MFSKNRYKESRQDFITWIKFTSNYLFTTHQSRRKKGRAALGWRAKIGWYTWVRRETTSWKNG